MDSPTIQLRALQVTPTSHEDQEGFDLHDPAGIAPDVFVPRELGAVLALCDGTRDAAEILAILQEQEHEIDAVWLDGFLAELDEMFLLDTAHFREREAKNERELDSSGVRPATLEGRSYPANPLELRAHLNEKLAIGTQRLPAPLYNPERIRGIVTPHIDFGRGGHVEAASYAPLLENVRATGRHFDTLVILGIAHAGVRYPFCATNQDFATPFGVAQCDRVFIENLREFVGPQLLREQNAHQNEHSVEFSAVFCQMFDELKPSKIAPILCGGFWKSLQSGDLPELAEPEVGQFIAALREVTQKHEAAGHKIGFIASVDGAHVGTQFGDATPLTPANLKGIEGEDTAWISALERGNKADFHAHFAKNGNANNVDAHPALYTLLAAFPGLKAQKLDYDQAFHERENIVVSFVSLALFDA